MWKANFCCGKGFHGEVKCRVCGGTLDFHSDSYDAEWKSQHYTCDECRESLIEESNKVTERGAERLVKSMRITIPLPKLEGSAKQVTWAGAIRGGFVRAMKDEWEEGGSPSGLMDNSEFVRFWKDVFGNADAGEWIRERYSSFREIALAWKRKQESPEKETCYGIQEEYQDYSEEGPF